MNYLEIEKKYNNEFNPEYFYDNIYSLINPVGKYDYFATSNMLSWYIKHFKDKGYKLSSINLLDAGCGDGRKSRIVAELIGDSARIQGFELSDEGVRFCNRLNGSIKCQKGDIVNNFPIYENRFEGIYACCVFMFLRNESEILMALNNIYKNLSDDGLFLWFDVNEKSHNENPNLLYCGFSTKEMDYYASKAGLTLLDKSFLFRNVRFIHFKKSTYYLVDKIGFINAELINKFPIFKPSFNARIYHKT